jgi:hypothetical protein
MATAYGMTLTLERIEIYQESLAEFTEKQVISAMTWAVRNLTRFPTIADLRIQIEGSDEDHANKAWDAVIRMLYTTPVCRFVIVDLVMIKTIRQTWSDLTGLRHNFARPLDDIAIAAMKRAWKLAYTENYKQRDGLGPATDLPPYLEDPIPANADDYAYTRSDYVVDRDHVVVLHERRTVLAPPHPARGPMPEDMKQRVDAMLKRIGRGAEARDAPGQTSPERGPALVVRRGGDVLGDLLGDIRQFDVVVDAADGADHPAAGDAADQDAPADADRAPQPPAGLRCCTCSGVAGGGPCNCRNGQS